MSEVVSVRGPVAPLADRACDAHCHLWISPAPEGSPRLADARLAAAELESFAAAGGGLVIDCQPVAAGRDGTVLAALMERTGVAIVSCTGYHLYRHYLSVWGQRKAAAQTGGLGAANRPQTGREGPWDPRRRSRRSRLSSRTGWPRRLAYGPAR